MDSTKLTSKVSKLLFDVISTYVREHTNNVIELLAKDYNLDCDELKGKYGKLSPNIEIGKNKKKNQNGLDGQCSEPKKRGRKKKIREELIETEEYVFNGVTYLVDNDNNVYTYNVEQPVLIGTKLIDGRVKFLQS
jgi:hypothetical protein